MTVQQCWDHYQRHVMGQQTHPRRQKIAWKRLAPFFANKRIADLRPNHYAEYARTRTSPATAKRELTILRAAFKYALRSGFITHAPYVDTRSLRDGIRREYLTPEQLKELVVAARAHDLGDITEMLCLTGQRVGAVLALEWWQIDFQSGLIDFNRPSRTRTKQAGVVPMGTRLRELLVRLKQTPAAPRQGERVFTPHPSFYRDWHRMSKATGFDWVTPHHIRHSVTTHLVREGVPIPHVAKLLGHKSSTITERVYAKFAPGFLTGAVGLMDEAMRPAPPLVRDEPKPFTGPPAVTAPEDETIGDLGLDAPGPGLEREWMPEPTPQTEPEPEPPPEPPAVPEPPRMPPPVRRVYFGM